LEDAKAYLTAGKHSLHSQPMQMKFRSAIDAVGAVVVV
jgi:hypothetical protein